VVGSLCLASPTSAAALEGLLPPCASAGLGLAVDVNWRPVFWGLAPDCPPPPAARAVIGALLERADLVKFAREEADGLFAPGADPAAIARALPRHPAVLITDGPRPLRWWWAIRPMRCAPVWPTSQRHVSQTRPTQVAKPAPWPVARSGF
jgi:fructokinase